MVSTFSKLIHIPIQIGDEEVVLVCRKPTADEMNTFLSSRFVTKGRNVQQNFVAERVKLIDSILVDVKNAGYENAAGEMVALSAGTNLSDEDKAYASALLGTRVQTWKDLVNINWKCAAAMRFEEPPTDESATKN